jgi:hypothetical protein
MAKKLTDAAIQKKLERELNQMLEDGIVDQMTREAMQLVDAGMSVKKAEATVWAKWEKSGTIAMLRGEETKKPKK